MRRILSGDGLHCT